MRFHRVPCAQVYLLLGQQSGRSAGPVFMHNDTVDVRACPWQLVATEVTLPACLPLPLWEMGFASGMRVTGYEPLLPGAVRRGTFFVAKHLKTICKLLKAKCGQNLRASEIPKKSAQDRTSKPLSFPTGGPSREGSRQEWWFDQDGLCNEFGEASCLPM